MKNLCCLLTALILSVACDKDEDLYNNDVHDIEKAIEAAQSQCGVTALPWLYDLLLKAEEDRTDMSHKGNYIGIISIVKHEGSTLFYTNFGLESALAFHLFDCDGNFSPSDVKLSISVDEAHKRSNIIYSTVPL